MKVALTGYDGFFGRHIRIACGLAGHEVRCVPPTVLTAPEKFAPFLADVDVLVHAAGRNRGLADEVSATNVQLAEAVAAALRQAAAPVRVVFTSSVQAGNGTPYGDSKVAAEGILAQACSERGVDFHGVRLPNLYGERGRPDYNSVVATFSHRSARGIPLDVHSDADLDLLHAQDAAEHLIALAERTEPEPLLKLCVRTTIPQLATCFTDYAATYAAGGVIPELPTLFHHRIFAIFRWSLAQEFLAFPLTSHVDERGRLFETVRHGGVGQTFFSSTEPGQTRGVHFHRRKFERFTVVDGEGVITVWDPLRPQERRELVVSGDDPVSVDMRTLQMHSLTNVGSGPLLASFWVSEHLDPNDADTHRWVEG